MKRKEHIIMKEQTYYDPTDHVFENETSHPVRAKAYVSCGTNESQLPIPYWDDHQEGVPASQEGSAIDARVVPEGKTPIVKPVSKKKAVRAAYSSFKKEDRRVMKLREQLQNATSRRSVSLKRLRVTSEGLPFVVTEQGKKLIVKAFGLGVSKVEIR